MLDGGNQLHEGILSWCTCLSHFLALVAFVAVNVEGGQAIIYLWTKEVWWLNIDRSETLWSQKCIHFYFLFFCDGRW